MKNIIIALIILLCIIANLAAQEADTSLKQKPAQLTLFYPIGIFGVNAQDYSYSFSVNVLAGRTGGTEGCEIGGLINVNDKFITGFQAAGIGNTCFGKGHAFQASGIFNVVVKDFYGFQCTGIANAVGGFSKAGQFAGIGNFTNGSEGAQFAGIVNVSSDSVYGVQFAGIANAAVGNSECVQTAGIVNVAENIKGVQLGGIGNVALKIKGAQLAGISNIAGTVEGVQLSAILNICDSINGVPIALISFVRKNGYRKFEISANEITYANASFKTGIRKFYTLFTIGYNPSNEMYNVSYGFGVGSSFLFKKQSSAIDLELRCSQLTNDFESEEMLILNSLILDYSILLSKHVELFAGPTVNLMVADEPLDAIKAAPQWAKAYKYDNRLWGWFGFHAGLRF